MRKSLCERDQRSRKSRRPRRSSAGWWWALKGDQRNMSMLFRLAEQAGQFEDKGADITEIRRVIVRWKGDDDETETEY